MHRIRRWWVAGRLAVVIGVITLGPGINPALAGNPHSQPAIGDVSVFASVPAPGHPFGIAVDDKRVYVSTSAGDFFADPDNCGHRNSINESVLTYDDAGHLIATTSIYTGQKATMGLFGIALDGNSKLRHKLYVADMNGRILRLDPSQHPSAPELFAQVPDVPAAPALPCDTGGFSGWKDSMWNDLVFDRAGNLYVPDDKPRIWRVSPDGVPSIWFTDPRLIGFFGFAGGPLGARIDPTGKWLYFSITVSGDPAFQGAGIIYKLRLVDSPQPSDLVLVHVFQPEPNQAPPQPTGIAFAKSGNLYVSLLGPNKIAILNPDGTETRPRISDSRFLSPWGLAFMGNSLLVTNGDLEPGAGNVHAWKIFKVFVGEAGLPLIKPRTPHD